MVCAGRGRQHALQQQALQRGGRLAQADERQHVKRRRRVRRVRASHVDVAGQRPLLRDVGARLRRGGDLRAAVARRGGRRERGRQGGPRQRVPVVRDAARERVGADARLPPVRGRHGGQRLPPRPVEPQSHRRRLRCDRHRPSLHLRRRPQDVGRALAARRQRDDVEPKVLGARHPPLVRSARLGRRRARRLHVRVRTVGRPRRAAGDADMGRPPARRAYARG